MVVCASAGNTLFLPGDSSMSRACPYPRAPVRVERRLREGMEVEMLRVAFELVAERFEASWNINSGLNHFGKSLWLLKVSTGLEVFGN